MSDRTEVNRRNAALSTGPRTPAGKAVVSRNAVQHGTFAALPVIPGVEREEDWQVHRAGILESLAPAGLLETRLAERAALLLWRLERVARYETAVIRVGLDEAADPPQAPDALTSIRDDKADNATLEKATEMLAKQRKNLSGAEAGLQAVEQLPSLAEDAPLSYDAAFSILEAAYNALPDDTDAPWVEDEGFLEALGVPESDSIHEVNWTAYLVRCGIAFLAKQGRANADRLAERAARGMREHRDDLTAGVQGQTAKVKDLRRRRETQVERAQARRTLPEANAEAKVLRYEAHLNRQLFQTLHELERIQANRAGRSVPLPLAVDVGVEISAPGESATTG
jgi:hypothetical protein